MKYLLHFIALFVVISALLYPLSRRTTVSPNIILISIDTLRADHLSCYGYHRPTPYVDELSRDSVLFENAFSQAPWTTASHMSLFTSLYPSVHRVSHVALSDVRSTLVADFQHNGYQTAAFVAAIALSGKFGFNRGFDEYHNKADDPSAEANNFRAFEWLDQRNAEKPFFLFLHYYDVHRRYEPKAPYNMYYCRKCNPSLDSLIVGPYGKQTRLTLQELYDIVALYDGEIRYMDDQIGNLIQYLKDKNLYHNSMVILLSDHGEGFLEHGLMDHGNSLYQELMRVPLLTKFPREQHKGLKIKTAVRLIDVLPTVVDYLKWKPAQLVQGISLLPLLRNTGKSNTPVLGSGAIGSEMISDGQWKLIHNSELEKRLASVPLAVKSEFELYDLEIDPREHNNLAGVETAVQKKLWDMLQSQRQINERLGQRMHTEHKPLDREMEEQLRTLGYVQ